MAQVVGSELAGASPEPTVASVLGVKGQLRFHPHGSTQKAHVVLRQVELSEESDDEGDSSTVYFSLFAQKRIEVKPGKEILLAVAAPDGTFLETPVVFAAKVSGEDVVESNGPPPSSRLDLQTKSRPLVIPPKLRKPWHEGPISEPAVRKARGLPIYTSVGVQAGSSKAIEEQGSQSRVFSPTSASAAPILQTQPATTDASSALSAPSFPPDEMSVDRSEHSPERGRSLSPMEIDSRSSTPVNTPPPASEPQLQSPPRVKSTSFSPPGLSSPQQLPQTKTSPPPPLHAPPRPFSASPDSDEPPGLSLPPLPAGPLISSPKTDKTVPTANSQKSKEGTAMSAVSSTIPAPISDTPQVLVHGGSSPSVEDGAKASSQQPTTSVTPPAAPYVPRRKTVPNPFVSGGMITDFVGRAPPVGKTTSQTVPASAASTASTVATVADFKPTPSAPAPAVQPAAVQPPPSVPPPRAEPEKPLSPQAQPTQVRQRSPATVRRAPSPPLSPASSSKVKIEDVPSLSSVTQPAISLSQFVIRPPLPPPAPPPGPRTSRFSNAPPHAAPPTTDPRRRPSDTGIAVPAPTPPPDYKSLAYVSEGSYSNPLNIRPAGTNKWKSDKPLPPQISTSAPPKSGGSKKPVAIGSGWPYNRQANGGNAKQNAAMRRASFQNGPGANDGAQSFLATTPPRNGPSNGSGHGGWHNPGQEQLSMLRPLNTSPTNVGFSELPSPAAASPISSSDPGDSPTSAKGPQGSQQSTPAQAGPSASWSPGRGTKRAASPPPKSPDARRARTFKWPTSNGLHSVKLKGDDDVGIRTITHSSDGSLFAVTCFDKSVRIWSNKSRTELAKLAHNMQITDVAWMDRDAGVVTLGDNGIVSTWTRSAANKWQWAKILDASGDRRGEDGPCCLAFSRDRMAIAYPRSGVKVWLFIKGTWLPQRSILRQNVTAIKFIEDGEALIGGTTDGVLWYCQIPNGTLRAYAFLRSKISSLDVDSKGSHALAAQTAGCILVNIGQADGKGSVEQAYTLTDPELLSAVSYDFGALFATRGLMLLFGTYQGCIMVWDRASGDIVHGLYHGEEHAVHAVSSFDGGQAADGYVLTGSRQGQLTWFAQPPVDGAGNKKGAW